MYHPFVPFGHCSTTFARNVALSQHVTPRLLVIYFMSTMFGNQLPEWVHILCLTLYIDKYALLFRTSPTLRLLSTFSFTPRRQMGPFPKSGRQHAGKSSNHQSSLPCMLVVWNTSILMKSADSVTGNLSSHWLGSNEMANCLPTAFLSHPKWR